MFLLSENALRRRISSLSSTWTPGYEQKLFLAVAASTAVGNFCSCRQWQSFLVIGVKVFAYDALSTLEFFSPCIPQFRLLK
jgi:hypothetical protein